ncbi:MAG: hypothetical protein ISR48_09785 [Alphaproteobacteria bacterium]|nr:hypothetical protein [Alphaproteobacteria bacterium]
MDLTVFEISLATLVVLVGTVGLFIWFYGGQIAAAFGRMTCMMTRLGLDPEIATQGDPQTKAMLKEAQQRCRRCRVEDFCDRWLAGKARGDHRFCPNAHIFDGLT